MRIDGTNEWATQNEWTTQSGRFVGIAIGPASDEGHVVVNGVRLKAGVVLPLAASQYSITRAGSVASSLLKVARLEVMLFECVQELMLPDVRRAPGLHHAGPVAVADNVTWVEVVSFPFVLRRQARIALVAPGAAAAPKYRVRGRFYSQALGAAHVLYLNENGAAGEAFDETDRTGVVVGGTDHQERFAEIVVEVVAGSAAAINVSADVETGD